jgi:hypothetical protein
MARKYESDRHIEDLGQAEVSAAIQYLDPELGSANEQHLHGTDVVILVILVVFVLGALLLLFCKA